MASPRKTSASAVLKLKTNAEMMGRLALCMRGTAAMERLAVLVGPAAYLKWSDAVDRKIANELEAIVAEAHGNASD